MKACGLIVEYNPLHNGHLHHIQTAKEVSQATCMIAVMSGSFLQRGEPAIIDKFHRTRAALASGVDIVLELPYAFAVQSSDLFATGAVETLNNIGASSICFGSESGVISDFIDSYHTFYKHEQLYEKTLQLYINKGVSFPYASKKAYEKIGLTTNKLDLSKPNNILGYSYVKNVLNNNLPIKLQTIKRINNNYHEQTIKNSIASATSIRNQLITEQMISQKVNRATPKQTIEQLINYKNKTGLWHTLEKYFPYIHYRVTTMSNNELAQIHGVDEGLENRIIRTAKNVSSLKQWLEKVKTKRYTWTRLQRMFIHILTNTKKADINEIKTNRALPYIRVLGLSTVGKAYLNIHKKDLEVPVISSLSRNPNCLLAIEEKATNAYYSILQPDMRSKLFKQELKLPILA